MDERYDNLVYVVESEDDPEKEGIVDLKVVRTNAKEYNDLKARSRNSSQQRRQNDGMNLDQREGPAATGLRFPDGTFRPPAKEKKPKFNDDKIRRLIQARRRTTEKSKSKSSKALTVSTKTPDKTARIQRITESPRLPREVCVLGGQVMEERKESEPESSSIEKFEGGWFDFYTCGIHSTFQFSPTCAAPAPASRPKIGPLVDLNVAKLRVDSMLDKVSPKEHDMTSTGSIWMRSDGSIASSSGSFHPTRHKSSFTTPIAVDNSDNEENSMNIRIVGILPNADPSMLDDHIPHTWTDDSDNDGDTQVAQIHAIRRSFSLLRCRFKRD